MEVQRDALPVGAGYGYRGSPMGTIYDERLGFGSGGFSGDKKPTDDICGGEGALALIVQGNLFLCHLKGLGYDPRRALLIVDSFRERISRSQLNLGRRGEGGNDSVR